MRGKTTTLFPFLCVCSVFSRKSLSILWWKPQLVTKSFYFILFLFPGFFLTPLSLPYHATACSFQVIWGGGLIQTHMPFLHHLPIENKQIKIKSVENKSEKCEVFHQTKDRGVQIQYLYQTVFTCLISRCRYTTFCAIMLAVSNRGEKIKSNAQLFVFCRKKFTEGESSYWVALYWQIFNFHIRSIQILETHTHNLLCVLYWQQPWAFLSVLHGAHRLSQSPKIRR